MSKRIFWILFFIVIFIVIRSINYEYYLNWSGDQANFGTEALRIFRTKAITLIGPQISANLQGRFIFQGPLIYYFSLFFLFLGRWDPLISSYLFMLFASIMIFPLFYGVKKLINEKVSWLMVIIYTLLPYYINYTRFIWNTTFLLALLPILILLMGLFKEKKEMKVFFLLSVWLGILLQFHYQFAIIIAALFIYYFFFKRLKGIYLLLFLLGNAVGFSPILIFELKHNFYNFQTLILYIQNWSRVDRPGNLTMPHYYTSLSFMLIITILGYMSHKIMKISYRYFFIFAFIVGIYALILNIPKPKAAFWAPTSPWNYLAEKKIYEIIRSTKITKDFNVANLAYYDTRSAVIKYFMKRDGYEINYDDYYGNKYLFVVTEGSKYLSNPSYEVATFNPHKILNQWNINDRYKMLLLERIQIQNNSK